MNGTNLALGFVAGWETSGGDRTVGAETHVNNELAELTEGGLVRRFWVHGCEKTFP